LIDGIGMIRVSLVSSQKCVKTGLATGTFGKGAVASL